MKTISKTIERIKMEKHYFSGWCKDAVKIIFDGIDEDFRYVDGIIRKGNDCPVETNEKVNLMIYKWNIQGKPVKVDIEKLLSDFNKSNKASFSEIKV